MAKKTKTVLAVSNEVFSVEMISPPEKYVLKCPACGEVLAILEKAQADTVKSAECLTCKALYTIKKK